MKTLELAKILYDYIPWGDMEAAVYDDGEECALQFRMVGSFGEQETEQHIVNKIPLGGWYWSDVLEEWKEAEPEEFIERVLVPTIEGRGVHI